ncbi:uncharacterized protein [Musca autumnalis]|uniref:uncharacterized protein n=1 Tax=Musca autumnalis TaxID=221902 RepID=UPI003CEA4261
MKIFIITLICGIVGYAATKPLESSTDRDATDALIEIEKQRLIKFPEELDDFRRLGGVHNTSKTDEAKRILEEIEKINQALGYVKKSDHSRTPAILDSSQYLFPNAGYQPFHAQNPQITGSHGETLLVPSIRAVKFDAKHEHKASEYNKPPVRKTNEKAKIEITKANLTKVSEENATAKPTTKPLSKPNKLYFHPQRVEVPTPQTADEKKLLPTHFVIPVRLYKHNKQQYVEKHNPQEYKIKGYKIVGDIDHFYGKTKTATKQVHKVKSSPKYHLLFLPQNVMAKNRANSIEALDAATSNSTETSSREEKLANRPFKLQTNTQATSSGNFVNSSSSATIVRKRIKPLKGQGQSVLSVTSASVIKVTPAPATVDDAPQQQQQQLQQTQIAQPPQQQQQQQQPQYQKPSNGRPNNQPLSVSAPGYLSSNQQPTGPTGNSDNGQLANNNGNNNNNQNVIKNRPAFVNPLLGLQSNIQNNINNINNATSNAIKAAFQNIFRLPFRPDNSKPQQTATDFPLLQTTALQPNQQDQQQQQQVYYTLVPAPAVNGRPPIFIAQPTYQSDHLDSDYKWDDENVSNDSDNSEDKETATSSEEPAEEKFLGQHQPIKHMQETQKEALKQGGIIIQKLKVRKGGIAIAGPGGVATAGSGGTAIVGPGGYALTHPRSLTIAGPGTKVIAIPANVDLKDALQRTNIKTKMIPREGRIVATGPTVYYAPGTIDAYLDTTAKKVETKENVEKVESTKISQGQHLFNVGSSLTQFQQIQPQVPYFVLNNGFYDSPLTRYAYTTNNQFVPQFLQNPIIETKETAIITKPKAKNAEPTTKRPKVLLQAKPPKLQVKTNTENNKAKKGDFLNDKPLLEAVKEINPQFVVEDIMVVPGRHVYSTVTMEFGGNNKKKPVNKKPKTKAASTKKSQVKVEAISRTATSGNIPQIPFGTYFLPYFSQGQQQEEQLQLKSQQRQKQNKSQPQKPALKTASLILEPHSKAIVGNGGTAISSPISRAVLKRGVPTNVYFNPESVAIAGVGGKAHAQADLELDLHRSIPNEEALPYYGGLKGQVIHIKDGRVHRISLNGQGASATTNAISRQGPTAALSSSISITAHDEPEKNTFAEDFNRIQLAAARLVAIQEMAKKKGTFSDEDNRIYAASLLELGQAAQSLALLQQTGKIQDFSVLLKPYSAGVPMPQKTPIFTSDKNGDDAVTVEAPVEEQKVEEQKVEEVTEQQFSEADLLPVTPDDPYEDVQDSVAVGPPKKDASVAEAKPVGVSIVGEGGVASSKPNAVALSGRNGLAVSAPKATAIAGVSPEEAAAFSVSVPSRNQLVIKSAASRLTSYDDSPSYDDYDYIETSPIKANTRNAPLLRSSGLVRSTNKMRPKPMMATASAADRIVQMWRTAIAEDYASPNRDDEDRLDDYDIEQLYKISKKLSKRRRY